ncbi:hypothetical protein [Bergeyella sp. RCAD1439]|uniref:hypothetical protein n=1 Tax=Bergeyella anatis TaxID=3113737 RepID=UPI002E1886B0|nr:hypothetical protein [Bergeyella sp. RCAD1439]
MKKLILLICGIFAGLCAQSCQVYTDMVFHKDASYSFETNADFSLIIEAIKKADHSDKKKRKSKKNNNDLEKNLEKIPNEWTSLYQLRADEKNKAPLNEDSARVLKKIFIKGLFDQNELSGMAIKADRLTQEDHRLYLKTEDPKSLDSQWDGKTLMLDTKQFTIEGLSELLEKNKLTAKEKKEAENMLHLLLSDFVVNLKFESDIEEITGKHPFVTPLDKRTVQIKILKKKPGTTEETAEKAPEDSQIIIRTR